METKQLELIRNEWPDHARKALVLDVPDLYDSSETELRALLLPKIQALIEKLDG